MANNGPISVTFIELVTLSASRLINFVSSVKTTKNNFKTRERKIRRFYSEKMCTGNLRNLKYSGGLQIVLGILCIVFGVFDRKYLYKHGPNDYRAFQSEGVIAIWIGAWVSPLQYSNRVLVKLSLVYV